MFKRIRSRASACIDRLLHSEDLVSESTEEHKELIQNYVKTKKKVESTLRNSLIYNLEKNYKLVDMEFEKIDIEAINPEVYDNLIKDVHSICYKDFIRSKDKSVESINEHSFISIVFSRDNESFTSIKIKADTEECKKKLVQTVEESIKLIHKNIDDLKKASSKVAEIMELNNDK